MVYHGHSRGRRGGHALDDSIGNRKGPGDADRHLPDDYGNRKGPEDAHMDVPDDIGNRMNGPVPGSRSYLRGKLGKKQGKKAGGPYKDMESLYAAQGDGVPLLFRPGVRMLPSGELAGVGPGGELKPLGVTSTGERLGSPERFANGDRGPESHGHGHVHGDEGLEPGEGKRKRRRRRKRKGGGEAGAAGGEGQPPAQSGGWQGGQGFDEDEDTFRYTLKSDPEVKRTAALKATEEVLKHAGRQATVTAQVVQEPLGPRVVVEIQDKGQDGTLFGRGSAALSALTFLVNKIINRFPDDRIRLSIVEAGTYVPPAAQTAPAPEAAPSGQALPWGALVGNRAPARLAEADANEDEGAEEDEDQEELDEEGEEEALDEDEEGGEDSPGSSASTRKAPARSSTPAPARKSSGTNRGTTRRAPAGRKSSSTSRRPGRSGVRG